MDHTDFSWTYFNHTKNCYAWVDKDSPWPVARDICRNMSVGVDLVSIHDMETNQFLMELSHGKPFYNGGHRSRAVNNVMEPWMWTDGSKFDWSNWSTGDVEHEGPQRSLHPDWSNWSTGEAEPNGIGDQFELRKDGRWHSSESRPGVSIICQFTPPSLPKGNI